jgi:PIN domain nuclease of toxin-antitoxin system
MKALLDTHTFLFWITGSHELSESVKEIIKNPSNVIYFSAASAWEIVVKSGIERITLTESPGKLILAEIQKNSFHILPVFIHHVLAVYELPAIHKDPFDRILAAQSKTEELPLLSRDRIMGKYGIKVIW